MSDETRQFEILLVEDNPGDVRLTQEALKEGTLDREQVDRWWERSPQANIGIVTGATSRLVVLDVDVDTGGEESLKELEAQYGELPPTTIAITGSGGLHYFFRHPASEVRNSAGKLAAGLDIRGDGGYVLAPPSRHASGGGYSVIARGGEIPPMPDWLVERLKAPTPAPRPATNQFHRGGDTTAHNRRSGARQSRTFWAVPHPD